MSRRARQVVFCLLLAPLLASCADERASGRAMIRSWCENNPDYCDMNAVH